ncbi:MAG: GntR family transcriptional regulator [Verrucomicrobiota bacterium]
MKNVNSDVAYDYIRKRILSGEYPAGHSLSTNSLSPEIGVSRTPVRDALRQLEADGLVTIQARLGARVKSMDLKEFSEMCSMRLALESHAAGLAATHRTEADLHEIAYALEAMRSLTKKIIAVEKEDVLLGELRKEDVRFHVAIMAAAKNDLMRKEILRLHLINRVVSSPSPAIQDSLLARSERDQRRREVLASHEEIFEAIKRSDVVAAKHAMERHIQDIVDTTLRAMARFEGRQLVRELTEEELSYSA